MQIGVWMVWDEEILITISIQNLDLDLLAWLLPTQLKNWGMESDDLRFGYDQKTFDCDLNVDL